MTSPLPPDPYEALGVNQDAEISVIRAAHGALVLKHHPDRIRDQALKDEGAAIFFSIRKAYELLSDSAQRQQYDDKIRLAELRKKFITQTPHPPSTTYPVRPAPPIFTNRRPEVNIQQGPGHSGVRSTPSSRGQVKPNRGVASEAVNWGNRVKKEVEAPKIKKSYEARRPTYAESIDESATPSFERERDLTDPYETLGVSRDANISTIRKAHRTLVLKHHPDRNEDSVTARDTFQAMQQAYELLSDPHRRSQYDNQIRRQGERLYRELSNEEKPYCYRYASGEVINTRSQQFSKNFTEYRESFSRDGTKRPKPGRAIERNVNEERRPHVVDDSTSDSSDVAPARTLGSRRYIDEYRRTEERPKLARPASADMSYFSRSQTMPNPNYLPKVSEMSGNDYASYGRPGSDQAGLYSTSYWGDSRRRSGSVRSRHSSNNRSLGGGRNFDRDYQNPEFVRPRAGSGSDYGIRTTSPGMPPQPKARASKKYQIVDPSDGDDSPPRRHTVRDSSTESDALPVGASAATRIRRYAKVKGRTEDTLKARQFDSDDRAHTPGLSQHNNPPQPPEDSSSVKGPPLHAVGFGSKPQYGVSGNSSSQMVGKQPILQKPQGADSETVHALGSSKIDVDKHEKSSQQNAKQQSHPESLETFRECYICGESVQIRRKHDWHKNHVLEDLTPYQCLEEACPEAVLLYPTLKQLRRHYSACHSTVPLLSDDSIACVFCGEVLPALVPMRFRHIGRHMEEIAFAVIPRQYEDWEFYSDSTVVHPEVKKPNEDTSEVASSKRPPKPSDLWLQLGSSAQPVSALRRPNCKPEKAKWTFRSPDGLTGEVVRDSVDNLKNPQTYDKVLARTGLLLQKVGFRLLDANKREDLTLLNLLCLSRVDCLAQAEQFSHAFDALDSRRKQWLVRGFNASCHPTTLVPPYVRTTLSETAKSTKHACEADRRKALISVMEFLAAKVFDTLSRLGDASEKVTTPTHFASRKKPQDEDVSTHRSAARPQEDRRTQGRRRRVPPKSAIPAWRA